MNSFDMTMHCEEFYRNEMYFDDIMTEINIEKMKSIQNDVFLEIKLYCVETPDYKIYQFSTDRERNEWLKIEWKLNCLKNDISEKEYSFNKFKKDCRLFMTNYLKKK